MLRIPILALIALLAAPLCAQEAATEAPAFDLRMASEVELGEFLWLNRLVVVFADTDRDPAFQRQMGLLAERPGELNDRDVVVLVDTDPAHPTEARLRWRPRGFSVILIDKDGMVKLRKPDPRDVRDISRSIDKTDLRRQELRDRRAGR